MLFIFSFYVVFGTACSKSTVQPHVLIPLTDMFTFTLNLNDFSTSTIPPAIYYFPKDKVAFINEYVKMQNKLDAPGHYIGWLSKRDKVYGFVFSEDWYDIGNMESYRKADEEYLNKSRF